MFTHIDLLIALIRTQWDTLRSDERGYTTEAVIATALLAAAAIAILGIIADRVRAKANSINLQ